MEKKELGVGQYVSTGTLFVKGRISPEVTKMSLTDHAKAAVLEYLTESDEFHKLVCDITGVERKQMKVSPELEKLKEDYSNMRENYEHEKRQRNDLLHKWREETTKRFEAEKERDNMEKHHKHLIDEIFSMLKEVKCSSVRGIVDELKKVRLRATVLAEDNESIRRECEILKIDYDKVCEELEVIKKNTDSRSDNYAKLAKSHEYLNKCNQNQAKTITKQINELLELSNELVEQKELAKKYMAKSEKLQSKLNKASKRYGELIKTISDIAIKSI